MDNRNKSLAIFEEWYKRQGYHVTFSASSGWVELSKGVFQAFPFSWIIHPSEDELNDLFEKYRIIALRYSTPIISPLGQISYHVIYNKRTYSLSSLPKKARHDVTHGLEYASYEPIPLTRLANEGWNLRKDTLIRQGRSKAETKTFWNKLCSSAEGLPAFEAWGALHDGQLVAALLSCTSDDTISILYQQSLRKHLRFGVNNALTYTFTQEAVQRSGIRRIFYGLHSLDAPQSVDEYKFRMNYLSVPVRQRVVFNPVIVPFLHPYFHKFLKVIKKIFKGNMQIAKGEGMLRFYLQGQYRLIEQEWPEVLLERKNEILAQAV